MATTLAFIKVAIVLAAAAGEAPITTRKQDSLEELLATKVNLNNIEARLAALEAKRERRLGVQQKHRLHQQRSGGEVAFGRQLGVYSDEELEATSANIALVSGSHAGSGIEFQNLADVLTQVVAKLGVISTCLDYMWLIISGALVMFMQAGFALLESGAVRNKNAGMVLLKNIIDVCIGTIAWFIVGYGLAYGVADEPKSEFVGTQNFAGVDFLETDSDDAITGSAHFRDWFFQWAFCATAATIVSGGVAERVRFPTYVVFSLVMTGFIYPVVVYWTWSGSGWLKGYSDFAGSGIVHLTGGISALAGAIVLGPRKGRFEDPDAFAPHNMGMVVLGTFVLWFGWYGFNCGSTLAFSDLATVTQAGLVAMNTTLSAAGGGMIVFLLRLRNSRYDLAGMCNGILAGLVSVCAGVGDMEPGVALITGCLGGLAYELGHEITLGAHIDDPLEAFSVHGCGGMVGVLTRPYFDRTGAKMEMLGWHFTALMAIVAWSALCSLILFLPLRLLGVFRVDEEEEEHGGDQCLSPSKMYDIVEIEHEEPVKDEVEESK